MLRARDHIVQVVCRRDGPLPALCDAAGLAAHAARFGGALHLPATWIARRPPPDIVLATGAPEWVSAALSPRAQATRLVLVRHMALPLSRRVRWLAARRADAVVAVSGAVRDALRAAPAIPDERLHVIYNATRFPTRYAVPAPADRMRARRALGLRADGRWVGFFGGGDPNKGIDDVVAAVRRAGDARLLLCGPRRADDAIAVRSRLDGRVHDLGETDRVEEALTACDVVVMATRSRLGEALPSILIEAMACGTPVLAYASSGMAEVIGADGDAGRLAAADDREDLGRILVDMLADRAGTERLAAAALERAAALFDPTRTADRYEQLFRSLTVARHEQEKP